MAGPYRILCFGDSLTEGYYQRGIKFHPYTIKLATLLRQNGYHVTVDNHGISGDTTGAMVPRFQDLLLSGQYNAAVVLGGTNDLMQDPSRTFNNIKTMHEAATNKDITTFAVTVPEVAYEIQNPAVATRRKAINNMLTDYCHSHNVSLIDLATLIPYHSMSPQERQVVWDDGIHFKPYGYDLIGEIVYKTVVNLFV